VNKNIGPVNVAQRLLDSVLLGFANNPRVFGVANAHRHSKLKGHIETWGSRRATVKLHPRQVVDGKFAGLDERPNALKTSLAGWDFERGPWHKAKGAKA
jgi:hypothetical protein